MGLFGPNVDKLKAKGDVDGLFEALGYPKTRVDAFHALGDLGGGQAIKALGRALNDGVSTHRHRATVELARLVDDRRAQDFLITAGTDSDPEVHHTAQDALEQVGLEGTDSPVGWLRKYRTARLVDFGLIETTHTGGRIWEFQLTADGLLYADAMLGERDCPEHPDILDDLNAVSRGRTMIFEREELAALASIAIGARFTNRIAGCARRMHLRDWVDGALLRFAGSMVHAVRHSPGDWTLATPLAEAELDAYAERVFERQLSAGQPTEAIQELTRAARDSWQRDKTEYRD